MSEVWNPMREVLLQSDFGVGITKSSEQTERLDVYKAIVNRNKYWQLIEFKFRIFEPDSSKVLNRLEEFVLKDVVIKKYISKEEALKYINAFQQLGLFKIENEQDLVDQCQHERGRSKNISSDGPYITFYITRKNNVRKLQYYDVRTRAELCPETPEWKQIIKIDSIFKSEWFLDRHD